MKRLLTITAIVLALGAAAHAQDDADLIMMYEMETGSDSDFFNDLTLVIQF